MTLTEFLLARIAEDEAVARDVKPVGRPLEGGSLHWRAGDLTVGDMSGYVVAYGVEGSAPRVHIARWDPARVLVECEAKQRIVTRHRELVMDRKPRSLPGPVCRCCGDDWPCPDLRDLALAYADHPDFRPEWRQ